MLTIGQLAAHANVTVAAVRHYHRIGLLPEPPRDASGYRTYGADDVVRLIRIHVLADAGVPLARVHALLDAPPEDFDAGVREVDERLRAEVRRLQNTRRRLAELAGGDRIALPESVIGYLDRLRALGVGDDYVAKERDAWVLLAAQMPDRIDEVIAAKHRYLEDPDMVRLYTLLDGALDWTPDEPRLVELADIVDRLWTRALEQGMLTDYDPKASVVQLLDAMMESAGPAAARLLDLMAERGWRGWTRLEPAAGGPRAALAR